MKRSISALMILLMGLMFSASSIALAEDKVAEGDKKEVATDSDKKADDGDKKKKKKKGKDGEEPECE